METTRTLIRTAVRTFYETRQILIIDALFVHSVLDADDLAILLGTQRKEVRKLITPLKSARLLDSYTRTEARVGASTNRGTQREYYYIPYHPAINAIKYRIMRLRRKVEETYKQDEVRKEWRCPRCKAEWEELQVLDSVGEDGFLCHRCGATLEMIEQDGESAGSHEKIRRLNIQLQKIDELMSKIDSAETPENTFLEAWERKKEVPRAAAAGQTVREYMAVSGSRRDEKSRVADQTDASALNINLTSGAEQDKEEEARKEARRAELAKQNQLPVWHTSSAIGANGTNIKVERGMMNGVLKKEEDEEKKPDVSMQNELDAYVAEMEREKAEEERKRAIEDAEDAEDDDEGDFEDVMSTGAIGTPSSLQHAGHGMMDGVKRELDVESGPSSDANTPASSSDRGSKRVKFESDGIGVKGAAGAVKTDGGDSDDEEDFEDAM